MGQRVKREKGDRKKSDNEGVFKAAGNTGGCSGSSRKGHHDER